MNDSVTFFKVFVGILAIPFAILGSLITPQKPQIYPGSMENYSPAPQEISTPVKNNLTPTPTWFPIPTNSPAVIIPVTSKVDCTGPDGKHLQISQKECDDFNNAWAPKGYVGPPPQPNPINAPRPSNNAQTSPSSTNYPPCTINYAFGGPYTYYYMTPEQCSAEQAKASSLNTSNSVNVVVTPYATPTLSLSQQQSIIDQHNSKVQQCQGNVRDKYSGILQSCNQYGGTSAYDACISLNSGYRQKEYDACGQIIN